MKKTNFDLYLEEQLKDPGFARRFKAAGKMWERKRKERVTHATRPTRKA
jgi:hypothetical protein